MSYFATSSSYAAALSYAAYCIHSTLLNYHSPELHCMLCLSYVAPSELHCSLWKALYPNELCCILLSYAAPYWAISHPIDLHCTMLSNASSWWATQPEHCTLLSYAALCRATPPPPSTLLNWAALHPNELQCIIMIYAAPLKSYLNLTELLCTLLAMLYPTELCSILWATLHTTWATYSIFVKFLKCWNAGMSSTGIRIAQSGIGMLQYRTKMLAGCQNTDAGCIGPNADAQLCINCSVSTYSDIRVIKCCQHMQQCW